jgi:hypothetical protein
MALPEGWLSMEAAGRLPEPDTSWMDKPWSRERFTDWMGWTPGAGKPAG